MKIFYNCFGKNKIRKHEKQTGGLFVYYVFYDHTAILLWTYFQTQKWYQCYILVKFRSTFYTKNAGLCSPAALVPLSDDAN